MKALVRHTAPKSVNLWNDMDRFLDSFFEDLPAVGAGVAAPKVDIVEEEGRYLLEAELPGMTRDSIDVKVDDTLLTISSTDEVQKEQEKKNYLVRERRTRNFSRSFVLPKDVDAGKIEAGFENGVLRLSLEKRPEAKPRQIKIG